VIPDPARLYSALSQLPCPSLALELACGDDPAVAHYFTAYCASTRFFAVDHDYLALKRLGLQAALLSPALSPTQAKGKGAIQNNWIQRAILLLASITALPFAARFDLIIARHPDIDRHRADWQTAFSRLPTYLSPGGHVLVTTYSISEADQLRDWLKVITADEVLLLNLAPPALTGRDRFIFCYRYPSP
jgi:hypothetical protein